MTTNSVSYNRTLFLLDNLPVLRGLDSDSVDLIATDPPFNKGVPAFKGKTKAGQNVEFKDVWNWNDDVQTEWLGGLKENHPRLFNMIHYTNESAGDDMGAFLCWMSVRVLEMHRVLKPTGSIYLHCDPTASHYLKAMMDAVFGRKQFRNEIVWQRTGSRSDGKHFSRIHDVLLFYSKTEDYVWNTPFLPLEEEYIKKSYRLEDENGKFRLISLHAPGISGGESGEAWRGIDPSRIGRHWSTPTKGVMSKFIVGNNLIDGWPDAYPGVHDRLDALDDAGLVYWPPKENGVPQLKQYLSASNGVKVGDIIVDIKRLESNSPERVGYPTQKPLALYKRMIEASSNPGDMVLDPFAGCATTCVAAEQLGRHWIGIDIEEESGDVIRERLAREVNGSMAWDAIVRTPTEAPERTDDGKPAAPELMLVSPKPTGRRIPIREVRNKLIIRDGQRCQGCGWEPHQVDYLQVDHNRPKTLGGKDEMDNYALLCDPCNRKKSNKLTLWELRQERASDGDWMNAEWWEEERWKR